MPLWPIGLHGASSSSALARYLEAISVRQSYYRQTYTDGVTDPSITLATFFTGLSTFPRAVLYIAAQSTGALVAAFLLKLGVGHSNYFAAVS